MSKGLKRLWRYVTGQHLGFAIQVEVPKLRLGSEYGQHCICTRGLTSETIIYSFGIGKDITFDLSLIERFQTTVHAFDPTPEVRSWLSSQRLPAEMKIYPWGLAHYDGTALFYPPPDPAHISHSMVQRLNSTENPVEVSVLRLGTIMARLGHTKLDVLKLDIEGAEYDVIQDLLASAVRPRQLLVEFHHQRKKIAFEMTRQAISRLNDHGYFIFDISDRAREYSFIFQEEP
jgi:FkbM family methyltransferase